MISQEELLQKVKLRSLEKVVYTRNQEPFSISIAELPPLIPSAMQANAVLNTKIEKESSYLKNVKFNGAYIICTVILA